MKGSKARMREGPIFFETVSVLGIQADDKTQTRRAFRVPEGHIGHPAGIAGSKENPLRLVWAGGVLRPRYRPGDILWVRETWGVGIQLAGGIIYRADYAGKNAPLAEGQKWRPSMIMPRELARIFLRVMDVRVERLQDISEGDIAAEGITDTARYTPGENIRRFAAFWDSFNAKRGYAWETNPWVWVYTFERIPGYK